MKLLNDLLKFFKFKFNEKNYNRLFFCENNNLYIYLEKYIKKNKSKNLVFSLERLNFEEYKNCEYIFFETLFFKKLFFLTLKIRFVYSSTPDLNNSLFMRSINKYCKYIYIQHSSVSLSIAYNENAFNNFDAVQVINKFQEKELKEINLKYNKKIKILKSKYSIFEKKNYLQKKIKKKILIAPTWSTDFYEKELHTKIMKILDNLKLDFDFKPHYMSIVKKELDINCNRINTKLSNFELLNNLTDYTDLITDWSGIMFEFAYLNKKKPILIETKKKIRNNNFNLNNNEPIEFKSRVLIGKIINITDIDHISDILFEENENDVKDIDSFFNKNFF